MFKYEEQCSDTGMFHYDVIDTDKECGLNVICVCDEEELGERSG